MIGITAGQAAKMMSNLSHLRICHDSRGLETLLTFVEIKYRKRLHVKIAVR